MTVVSASSERALTEALSRLAEGRPLRTDGALSVAGLATEAGVSRSTANRSTTALAALRGLRLAAGSKAEPGLPLFDERQARKDIADLRRRHAETVAALELSVDTLAQHVQVLTLDNERLRKALGEAGSNVAVHGAARGGA